MTDSSNKPLLEIGPSDPSTPIDWTQAAIKWLWRLSALLIWLAFMLHYLRMAPTVGWNLQRRDLLLAAGILVAISTALRLRKSKGKALGAIGLFPIYVLTMPVWLPFVILNDTWNVTHRAARNSQRVLGSLIPYAISGSIVALLTQSSTTRSALVTIFLCCLNIYLVMVSLCAWIFRPLPWGEKAVTWFSQWELKRALRHDLPKSEAYKLNLHAAKQSLADAIIAIRDAHDQLHVFSKLEARTQDLILIVAFGRKYVASLIHVAFIMGALHYVVASLSIRPAYQYIGTGRFADVWFEYFYFSAMTVVAGNTVTVPIIVMAKVATLLNTFSGIGFLVLLVTLFSMMTRERAREIVAEINQMGAIGRSSLEARMIEAVFEGNRSAAINSAAVAALERLRIFHPARAHSWHAIQALALVYHRADDLEAALSLEEAAQFRRAATTMSEEAFDELFHQIDGDPAKLSLPDILRFSKH